MTEWTIEWDEEDLAGLTISLNGLMPPKLVGYELKPLAANIVFDTSRYPPPIPDSTYIRTNKLFDAWDYYQMHPLAVKIENVMPYAGYVQGREQTALHKSTGWKVLFTVAEEKVKWLLNKLASKAEKIWTT